MALTRELFITIKTLQRAGSGNAEIARYLGISVQKSAIAYKSETFEEYQNNCFAISERRKKPKKEAQKAEAEKQQEPVQIIEHRQTVQIQATHYMMEEMREIKSILKQISAKMAYIVEDLCPKAAAETPEAGKEGGQ